MKYCLKQFSWLALILGGMTTALGCASSQPYMFSEIGQKITMSPSNFHQFTYIRAYEDDGEIVLYGKVQHSHEFCENEEHIDLASVDSKGTALFTTSLALRKQSNRKRGWYGAGFRTRIAPSDLGNGSILLAFHDSDCHKDLTFDCRDNQARTDAAGSTMTVIQSQ